ncbi:hypothetical protein [Cupriavidus lacunae]|nr:hypothetical protein [Cupriavidus lacunae]
MNDRQQIGARPAMTEERPVYTLWQLVIYVAGAALIGLAVFPLLHH